MDRGASWWANPCLLSNASREGPMEFNDLLIKQNIDPNSVLVLRHCPIEPVLKEILPILSLDRPELYNAYQQTQTPKVEASMKKTSYVASFIGHKPGEAFFVGLYKKAGSRPLSHQEYWNHKVYLELRDKYGMKGYSGGRDPIVWFDLEMLTDFYGTWAGRLVIDWPGPDRVWSRRAHMNKFSILSVQEEDLRNPEMQPWHRISWSWERLHQLTGKEKDTLKHWRGIYYIFDTSDQKGYVGSAGGADNLLGRWLDYKVSGDGGNKLLKKRDPNNFLFSILQRVPDDTQPDEMSALEIGWKVRLHTREPLGLNAN